MSNQPLIVCTPDVLSDVIGRILKQANSPHITKSAALNILAATIAGPKHNWGYLKGTKELILASGISRAQLDATIDISPSSTTKTRTWVSHGHKIPGFTSIRIMQGSGPDVVSQNLQLSDAEVLALNLALHVDQKAPRTLQFNDLKITTSSSSLKIHCNDTGFMSEIDTFEMRRHLQPSIHDANARFFATDAADLVHDAFISIIEQSVEILQAADEGHRFTIATNDLAKDATILFLAIYDTQDVFTVNMKASGTNWATDFVMQNGEEILLLEMGLDGPFRPELTMPTYSPGTPKKVDRLTGEAVAEVKNAKRERPQQRRCTVQHPRRVNCV